MSSVATPIVLIQKPFQRSEDISSPSFYRQRFKVLRVAGDFLLSLVMSVAYTILSGLNWLICRKSARQWYGSLARYNCERCLSRVTAYFCFDKVINFSTNSPKNSLGRTGGFEEMKKIYRDYPFEEILNQINEKSSIPIKKEKLSIDSLGKGICLGESLHFIEAFLEWHRENGLWVENIERASSLFRDGGTKEAEIMQALYHGQDITKYRELFEILDQYSKILKKHQQKDIEAYRKEVSAKLQEITGEKIQGGFDECMQKCVQIFRNLDRITPLVVALCDFQFDFKRRPLLDNCYSKSPDPSQNFTECIEQLPTGPYLIILHSGKIDGGGHALVFIKESKSKAYIFDPSYATFALDGEEKQIRGLWSLIRRCHPHTKDLEFRRCFKA